MRHFLALLFILSGASAFAGTAQVNSVAQIGGGKNILQPSFVLPTNSLSSMIQLSAYVASSGGANYLMLSRWSATGSSGQYQVTTGKTLRVVGMYVQSNTGNIPLQIGHGTAALGSDNTVTPPAGEKFYSAATATASFITESANVWHYYPFYMDFPALSYPFVKTLSTLASYNVILIGTEQ